MRLFKVSKSRQTQSLDGLWKFVIDPHSKGETEKWYHDFPDNHDIICVPGCWNCTPEYFKYEGKAWYKTIFKADQDTYVLMFDSVLYDAEIYIDGKKVASHYGGFTQFTVNGTGKGEHVLVVAVDNTHNDTNTIPLSQVDWYHYGGIAGSVSLDCFESAYIKTHKISYILDGNYAKGNVSFFIEGDYRGNAEIIFDGKQIAKFHAETGSNFVEVDFGNIERWDIENPKLYNVEIVIGCDDLTERIGFRTIETSGKDILLNGRKIKLKGINRHNEHPDFGFAVPFSIMKRDADIIKDMGCNIIRGSHYPNPPEFLDYMDQTGMLFWEEIPMWGYNETALSDPLTLQRGLNMHKEMIERDYHHPSIIIWGLHNEIFTETKPGYEITKTFSHFVRESDSTRLVTYASNRPYTDKSLEFADIVSMNIYPGWYGGHDVKKESRDMLDKLLAHLKETGNDNKPFIASEFGGGAVYGEKSLYKAKWTEDYQAELLKELIEYFSNHEAVSGQIVWQFCDMRSSFEMEIFRPRSFNNKGVLDEYRRPKSGYYVVKKMYNEK